jgi:hypothetical protein
MRTLSFLCLYLGLTLLTACAKEQPTPGDLCNDPTRTYTKGNADECIHN